MTARLPVPPLPGMAVPSLDIAISFDRVCLSYKKSMALDHVSFSVRTGEAFALVGLNGAGKTSLIKSLLDFCAIDSGRISLFGIDHRHTTARATVAFLPERFIPPYYLTGEDFLDYLLGLHGQPADKASREKMLEALDLDPGALGRLVRTYSKGMTQKLGLAATFLSRKPLLILDEPMSGLDPKSRALVKRQILLHKAAGHTVFFSSHMLPEVEFLCDGMAIIDRGRLRFTGSPMECREVWGQESLEEAFLHCIG